MVAFGVLLRAQESFEFDGQFSAFGSYHPDNARELLTGGRYIPELNYHIGLPSSRNLDFLASVNLDASASTHPFNDWSGDANFDAYRLWARYTTRQLELRLGLQKIDFGTATILRPLQWFNQIDPRDPLSLTNGVYGMLGRYYFLNNANIWLWALYGNEETRGFDAVKTHRDRPEFGGRIQYPVPAGEIALAYHHRTADTRGLAGVPSYEKIPENRFGADGKWDVGIGLWFEASFIHKAKNVGPLTNETLFNLGADYTFAISNGLNVVAEHLMMSYDESSLKLGNANHISAATLSYPFGLSNNLNTVLYHDWDAGDFAFFLNLEHRFKRLVGYAMVFYNPDSRQGFQQNELINNFSGPGIRLLLVYNH